MASPVAGQFIAGGAGPLFVLRRGMAPGAPCVLVVPPFAEEMNKSRRMVTLVASALADAGVTTVLPDLTGTGDSCGDFVDAQWPVWRDDLLRVARWCEAAGAPVTALLGIRLGCALACDAEVLAGLPALTRSVFWQPALDGSRHLMQFMRLRVTREPRKEAALVR
jgi:exosortase A-associated hydrolase 2